MIKHTIEQILIKHFFSAIANRAQLEEIVEEMSDAIEQQIQRAVTTAFDGIPQ